MMFSLSSFAVCRERSLLKSDGWESTGQTCEGNYYQKDECKDKDFYAIKHCTSCYNFQHMGQDVIYKEFPDSLDAEKCHQVTEQCDHAQALAGSSSQALSQPSFLAGREMSSTGQLKALVFSPPARRVNPAAELPAQWAWIWCRKAGKTEMAANSKKF